MNSISLLNFNKKPFKIIGSFFLLCTYYYFFYGLLGCGLILITIGFSIYAFISEKKLIRQGNERFHGDNLFFRYGKELVYSIFPIPVNPSWKIEESVAFANSLMDRIKNYFIDHYGSTPLNGQQIVTIVNVTDSNRPNDTRSFLKISFLGSRGALFSRFITYQLVGQYVVLHRAAYLLGIVHWYDIVFFVLSSPITILFWIVSWFKGEYSIYASIARNIGNSFESIDHRAYHVASAALITNATADELKAHGLYTEEMDRQMTFNFNGTINQFGSGNNIVSHIK